MFESAQGLRQEFADLEKQLADPAVVSDQARSRKVGRRYSELTGVVHALDEHQQLTEDLSAARELANDDPAFAAEADQISARLDEVTDKLTALLAPRDPWTPTTPSWRSSPVRAVRSPRCSPATC